MDWNVVVTTHDEGFDRAEEELQDFGRVDRTDFFNVLVMTVDDPHAFLEDLSDRARMIPDLLTHCVARVSPADRTFDFAGREEFVEEAAEAARSSSSRIAGRSFYVRVRRRGMGDVLSSHRAERAIADAVFGALDEDGETAEVDFDDPDLVLVVDTVGRRAGMALWSREELARFPFLSPD